jgi:mRNA interferase RelE/StbE
LAWTINYAESAKRELRKLDRPAARRIVDFMDNRIAGHSDPRGSGKALTGPLGDLWRYRIGDYRVICDLQDSACLVLVVRIGNRRDVYR